MPTWKEDQVVTDIPEDEEWDAQELVMLVSSLKEAEEMVKRPIPDHYPEGSKRYIEFRTYTDWERIDE